jgi:serine phosphatase RsbU (regulator of sigma subunit)
MKIKGIMRLYFFLFLLPMGLMAQHPEKDSLFKVWLDSTLTNQERLHAFYEVVSFDDTRTQMLLLERWYNEIDRALSLANSTGNEKYTPRFLVFASQYQGEKMFDMEKACSTAVMGMDKALEFKDYTSVIRIANPFLLGFCSQSDAKYNEELVINILDTIRKHINNDFDLMALDILMAEYYYMISLYPDALTILRKVVEVHERSGIIHPGLSEVLATIGTINIDIGNYTEADNYIKQALILNKSLQDTLHMGSNYIELSRLNIRAGNQDKALQYIETAIILLNPLSDDQMSCESCLYVAYTTKAEALNHQNRYQDALDILLDNRDYYEKSIALIYNGWDHIYFYSELGLSYFGLSDLYKAIASAEKGLEYSTNFSLNETKNSHEILYKSWEKLGDYHKAYKSYQNFVTINDSMAVLRNSQEVTRLELENSFQQERLTKELEFQKKINKEITNRNIFIGIGIIVLLAALGLFHRLQFARKTQRILKKTNVKIKTQRDEIETQRDEIESQRDLVIEQKNEVIESINYAKRIQSAMLPPETFVTELLNENFIFYKPRDIVSGDFYWIKNVNQYIILLVADCTGHGVPGALMSMLGISYLNEIVQRREITQANQILNELRKQIKHSLRQHGQPDEAKDGIDMALCVLDLRNMLMQYSGANNPLYLIRDVDDIPDLNEIKPDRMPIGYYQGKDKTFTNHEIQLQIGDTFYIFSDGFIDQKGGKENKKFMSKNFKNLLLEIHDQPMYDQKGILDKTLSDWRGRNSQMDDILVIGVRV